MPIDPENAIEVAPLTSRAAEWLRQASAQISDAISLGVRAGQLATAYGQLREEMPPAMATKTGVTIATTLASDEASLLQGWAVAQAVYADATGQTDAQIAAKVAAAVAAVRAAQVTPE